MVYFVIALAVMSFGILPIIYKLLLLQGLDLITIIIFTKIFSLIFIGIWHFYTIFIENINSTTSSTRLTNIDISSYIYKRPKEAFYIFILLTIAGCIYIVGQYSYLLVLDNYKTNIGISIIACYPAVSIILSYLIFNELLTIYQALGIFLILVGLVMATYKLEKLEK